jgi:probable rRNA maturation factor
MDLPDTGRAPSFSPDLAVRVEVADATGRMSAHDLDWLQRHAALAARSLTPRGEVRVRVVDDAEMADLHARFSHDPTTTDVLTFNLGEAGDLDTDLFVCLDVARRVAQARGHAPEKELLLYVVHGLLHCLGHDDHDPAEAARMHEREDEVLTAIGVGAVYAAASGQSQSPTPAREGR